MINVLSKNYEEFVKKNVLDSFVDYKSKGQGLSKSQAEEKFGKNAQYFLKADIENFEKAIIEKCEQNPEKYKDFYEEGYKQLSGLEKTLIDGQVVYVKKEENKE